MFPVTRRRFTAFVIFQGADHRRAWRIFTRRGWRHVLIVLPVHTGSSLRSPVHSLVINPLTWGVQCDVIFERPADLAQEALREGATCVVRMPVDQKFDREYIPRGLFTCVTLIKSILGVAAWYVWTPEHLARYLLRHGGSIVRKDLGTEIQPRAVSGRNELQPVEQSGR